MSIFSLLYKKINIYSDKLNKNETKTRYKDNVHTQCRYQFYLLTYYIYDFTHISTMINYITQAYIFVHTILIAVNKKNYILPDV